MKHEDVNELEVPRDVPTKKTAVVLTDREMLQQICDQMAELAAAQRRIEANVGTAISAAHGMRDRVAALEDQIAALQRREMNGGTEIAP